MQSIKFLLIGLLCIVGVVYGIVRSLTESQFIPPAEGRSAVDRDLLPVVSPSPEIPLSPLDEYRTALDEAEQYLQTVDSYTATFVRQVRKDDELLDQEEMSIKIRHQPFSVYMNWDDGAQQVLYVEGENDGRVLARRARGIFRRTLRLGPTSRIAMMDSRYPIYELGMLNLVENAEEALAVCSSLSEVDCAVETTDLDGQTVRQFTVDFSSPAAQDTYSHCVISFAEGDPMPVCITSHGWTEEGAPGGLVEYYYYRDLQMNPGLTDLDFDAENEAYGF